MASSFTFTFTFIVVLVVLVTCVSAEVCPPQNASCYYTFHVGQRLTLHAARFNNTCGSPGCFVESFNGSVAVGKNGEAMEHPETVITANGLHPGRLVVVAGPEENMQMLPGPAIEVYEGQEIVVDVINDQLVEGLTIHWHGQDQPVSGEATTQSQGQATP